jgi:hypothetical protein
VPEKIETIYREVGGFGTLLVFSFDDKHEPKACRHSLALSKQELVPRLKNSTPISSRGRGFADERRGTMISRDAVPHRYLFLVQDDVRPSAPFRLSSEEAARLSRKDDGQGGRSVKTCFRRQRRGRWPGRKAEKEPEMSERLETLKKARERMVEDRDGHAKVLAAPFDRDKAERARTKFTEIQSLIDALDRAISGEEANAAKG